MKVREILNWSKFVLELQPKVLNELAKAFVVLHNDFKVQLKLKLKLTNAT